MNLFCRSSLWICLFIFLTTPAFTQGPLTPPGPPGPIMKTLDQMEPRTPISALPFTITQPGSYYVTTNLVTSGTNGIRVMTNNVTIDLNGFSLVGGTGGVAIAAPRAVTNVTVRNGILQGWFSGLSGGSIHRGQFLNLQVSQCASFGISAGFHCLVKQCFVDNCGATGFHLGRSSSAIDCFAAENDIGFNFAHSATATGCRGDNNRGDGFSALLGSILVNCSASSNLNLGLHLAFGSTAANCSAIGNSTVGIFAESGSAVRDCTSRNNATGIRAFNDARVINNTVTANTSIGIHASSSDSTIEGNHVTDTTGTGILVSSSGNLIIRNSLSGNTTNFNVAPNNIFGPVITNSAGLTGASPWANLQF